ncbi:small acid-soluble spore protein P [Ferviditalea candida]|uniref:Small acid-soluble spore protein P n=1 Tax=Ferviditalea candida TaxID=3108399 RepID=A0ABU5ZMM6_9BACL|nr:small acid-soluble spore protein P [Paenibacillaceae bacterium T2]
MPKQHTPQYVTPAADVGDKREKEGNRQQEALSGSKKVKNRNHSRQNHGEGS